MILRIGRRSKHEVRDYAEASAIYAAAREESGEGGSTFPMGKIELNGSTVAHVSYNGKVWAGVWNARDWQPGRTPLFNPFAAEAR